MCGVVGLGRLVAEGRADLVEELRMHASDPRWRVREAVAMALQRVGDADTAALFDIVQTWVEDRAYVQRAAIAAVAEPRLLKVDGAGKAAIDLVDRVTVNLTHMPERRSDEFRTLRQALAYCWSVVVAGDPAYGWPRMENWVESADPDVRWLMSQNLKKARLARLDPTAVERLSNKTPAALAPTDRGRRVAGASSGVLYSKGRLEGQFPASRLESQGARCYMAEGDRPQGRKKRIGSGVGKVFRRGDGVSASTGGPVGDAGGYSDRTEGSAS